MRTFGIRQDNLPWMQWCGRDVKPDSLLCFHPSADFECLSPSGFAVFSLSFDEPRLALAASRLGHADFLDDLNVEQAVDRVDTNRLQELRTVLHASFSSRFMASTTVDPVSSGDQLETRIAEELVMLLTGTHAAATRTTLATRSRALRTAISYILEHAQESISVGQVCAAATVSWRTLDRAFKESLGVSPKACINAVRLHGARNELRKADPTARVADVANNWGFWHLGGFAKDYRRAFNELPSQTLASRMPVTDSRHSPVDTLSRLSTCRAGRHIQRQFSSPHRE
jgi:AraC-like DNA-binding protein